jgi:hypothetical protein
VNLAVVIDLIIHQVVTHAELEGKACCDMWMHTTSKCCASKQIIVDLVVYEFCDYL